MPYVPASLPVVTVPDQQRWDAVKLLLHDETLRTYTRVAGLFLLLFAQPLTQTVWMRTGQVHATDDKVLDRFHAVPVQMPPVLDDLVRDQCGRRGKSLYHSRDTGWLFPGGNPGSHLATWPPRTSAPNSSTAASTLARPARQPSSSSPAPSPRPSWPN